MVDTKADGKSSNTPQKSRDRSVGNLAGLLAQAIDLVGNLSPELTTNVEKLKLLEDRLAAEHFHLAVLGQFKRGKSTFLNALMGEEILPASVVPLTAIPTFIHWGPEQRARIIFEDDRPSEEFTPDDASSLRDYLIRFVTEDSNPKNSKGVLQAEVFHPSRLLSGGLVLIDTPGIGSTYQHNTETTLNFLPQCDAALFLVSADPPVTEVEIAFLREVTAKVSHLFFIFNKVDYLRSNDREVALAFFRKVLTLQAGTPEDVPIFPLSALEALEARQNGDQELLDSSGLEGIRAHLVDFLVNEKARVLAQAVAKKGADIAAQVLMLLNLTSRSLQMPIESLGERLALLEEKIREAERQRLSAGDLLAGDRKRTVEFLERQSATLRKKAGVHFEGVLLEATATSKGGESIDKKAREALTETIPGFFERELGEVMAEFNEHLAQILMPHQARAEDLIEAIRKGAAEIFEIAYQAPESEGSFEAVRQPYWVTHKWSSSLNPLHAGLFDWILPAGLRRSMVLKRLMGHLEDLIIHNVENLRWATLQNLDHAFRKFISDLDDGLSETISATHGAIEAVIKHKKDHTENVADEMSGIESSITSMTTLEKALRMFTP